MNFSSDSWPDSELPRDEAADSGSDDACRRHAGELTAWFDGEADFAQSLRVRAHLDACSPCRDRCRSWEQTRRLLREIPVPPTPNGRERLLIACRLAALRPAKRDSTSVAPSSVPVSPLSVSVPDFLHDAILREVRASASRDSTDEAPLRPAPRSTSRAKRSAKRSWTTWTSAVVPALCLCLLAWSVRPPVENASQPAPRSSAPPASSRAASQASTSEPTTPRANSGRVAKSVANDAAATPSRRIAPREVAARDAGVPLRAISRARSESRRPSRPVIVLARLASRRGAWSARTVRSRVARLPRRVRTFETPSPTIALVAFESPRRAVSARASSRAARVNRSRRLARTPKRSARRITPKLRTPQASVAPRDEATRAEPLRLAKRVRTRTPRLAPWLAPRLAPRLAPPTAPRQENAPELLAELDLREASDSRPEEVSDAINLFRASLIDDVELDNEASQS